MNHISERKKVDFEWFLILITFVMSIFVPVIGLEVLTFSVLGVLMFLLYILKKQYIISIKWSMYHTYMSLFLIFIYFSSFWALHREYTIGRGNTMLITTLIMIIISLCFSEEKSVDALLKIAMWGGYIISIIGIFYYGPQNVLGFIREGSRLTIMDTFLNINDLGMCATYAVIINIYFLLNGEKKLYSLLSIPALLITVASGSRKAIAVLVLGVASIYILKNNKVRNVKLRLLKICFSIVLLAIVLFAASRLSVFAGIVDRIHLTVNGILTGQNSDYSTLTRLNLIVIGQQIFREHPILGIGINNAQFIVEGIYHRQNYYLHNNYIELLADGGIIGFCIYYWIFFYLVIAFIKERHFSDLEFDICFILLVIHLIMDIGSVSFLNRTTYFYLLLFCIELRLIRQKKRTSM